MRILFISATNSVVNFPDLTTDPAHESNDALSDAMFLEAKLRYGADVYECPWQPHMYRDSPTDPSRIHGRGFGLHKRIELAPNMLSVDKAEQMIRDRFFDIVCTNSRTNRGWWDKRGLSPFFASAIRLKAAIFDSYPPEKVIFFDGEDSPEIACPEFISRSTYFKRERASDDPHILPIEYSLPQKNMLSIKGIEDKTKMLGAFIPVQTKSYLFEREEDFYEDYRTSYFGVTWKKLGWTCPRHCEIIFSACIPIFPDVDECPKQILTFYPKELCSEVLRSSFTKNSPHTRYHPFHDLYGYQNFELKMDDPNMYMDYLHQFQDHALKYLTTERMWEYVISKLK